MTPTAEHTTRSDERTPMTIETARADAVGGAR